MADTVLLVDNDKSLTDSIGQYLLNAGFIVDTANSVQDGISLLITNKPDLIISDILMPEKDGYYFLKYLKMLDGYTSIPFIFISAKGMTSDRICGYELGCQHYITKPFDPEELLAIIKSLLMHGKIYANSLKNEPLIDGTNFQDKNILLLSLLEHKVLQLVLKGMTNKEIADSLHFTSRNVEKYVSRLLSKTSTRNRTHLAQYCYGCKIQVKRANDGNRTRE